jgi:hypothetical protein
VSALTLTRPASDLPSPVFRESFILRCGTAGPEVRAFGGVLTAIGGERWIGSPTWARQEFEAAVRELRQALDALEVCAGNRDRTNAPFRPILGHVLTNWREHYQRHLAPLFAAPPEEA